MTGFDVVKRLYAAVASQDADALEACLHPDVVAIEADALPYGGRYEGKKAFLRLIDALREHWREFEVAELQGFEQPTATGAATITIFQFRATSRKTGKKIDQRFVEYWELRDDRVTFLQPFYFDTHDVRNILGFAD